MFSLGPSQRRADCRSATRTSEFQATNNLKRSRDPETKGRLITSEPGMIMIILWKIWPLSGTKSYLNDFFLVFFSRLKILLLKHLCFHFTQSTKQTRQEYGEFWMGKYLEISLGCDVYLVKDNFRCNIFRCSTESPCLSTETNFLGETKIN